MAVYYGNVAGNTAASNDAANYQAKVYQPAAAEDAGVSVEAGSLADGTYGASGKGIGGDVPVTVTVEGGTIAAVEVGKNSETEGIGSKAVEQLPDAIVAVRRHRHLQGHLRRRGGLPGPGGGVKRRVPGTGQPPGARTLSRRRGSAPRQFLVGARPGPKAEMLPHEGGSG